MRNISFFKTIVQMEEEIKDVTRRIGWWYLTEIDLQQTQTLLMAVQKGQGIKKGELKRIYPIQILSARAEALNLMTTDLDYGYKEVIREGFPNWTPYEFVEFFCDMNKCLPNKVINRIEFKKHIMTGDTTNA